MVGLLKRRALRVVHAEHIVVVNASHLDGEDGRLVRQGCIAHLTRPRVEVEVLDGWDRTLDLLVFERVDVLTWRIKAKQHSLRGEDEMVGPGRHNKYLQDVILLGDEFVLLILDVAVAELVADEELLSHSERSELSDLLLLRLIFW